ncbi:hypothetical protein BGZ65_000850, partial [Modicella reniformis]
MKAGIELENKIVPVECPQAEAGHQAEAWKQLQLSFEKHVRSVLEVQEPLRHFYRSPMFKIKSYRKQALSAVVNKGIDRVVSAAGCKGKSEEDSARPLFVVGDGQFGSRRGVSFTNSIPFEGE